MKTYWLIVLALALGDVAIGALLLLRDGGPEGLVWWVFLIVPLLVGGLIVVGLIMQTVVR